MKKPYLYWITTGLLAVSMLASGSAYFFVESMAENFDRLGFPDYFRIELGVAKIIGAIALLAPVPRRVKEWTYAGFGITFISAAYAHGAAGDPIGTAIPPVVALAILATSYLTAPWHASADASDEVGAGSAETA